MPPIAHQEAGNLLARLHPLLQRTLIGIVRAASETDRIWLVGGVVRDLLLGYDPGRDLDLAVEGDVMQMAPTIAAALGGEVIATHATFGTATLEVGNPALVIDLARARTETYAHPAALPEVQPASLTADLFRRDFTINAMALELAVDDDQLAPAPLIDRFNGLADLEAGILRVIHRASFRDDPTRILRGLRMAARLDLCFDPETTKLRDEALAAGYLQHLSPERIRHELCLAFEEPLPEAVFRLSDDWGLTTQIHPALSWSETLAQRCASMRTLHNSRRAAHLRLHNAIAYAGLFTYDLSDLERAAFVAHYHLPNSIAEPLLDLGRAKAAVRDLSPTASASQIDRQLRGINEEALLVVHYAEQPALQELISRYLREIRPCTTLLNGDDIQGLGIAPGPLIGRLLAELRAARLDNLVQSRDDELKWLETRIRELTGESQDD